MLGKNITKEELSVLEIESFSGRVALVQTVKDAEKAVASLRKAPMVGFDTETRPAYKKGNLHRVALIQMATEDVCFLFRLNFIGLPSCLMDLLSDPGTLKIGLSLKDDFRSIGRWKKFTPAGFVDLQHIVTQYGINDLGLQKIYALLFEKRISKRQRLTNWETSVLTDAQQQYAALDAWACLKIYKRLISGIPV
ncbi:MAG: 3'-5' exonuclease domain-containing protein 2 [Dysgonamonadaceae bacterium]|jgi:ribonuclease D|nr:3'-5' exonuclease domain-containing protein 2 [Dysgonamonadaceae bacterium]